MSVQGNRCPDLIDQRPAVEPYGEAPEDPHGAYPAARRLLALLSARQGLPAEGGGLTQAERQAMRDLDYRLPPVDSAVEGAEAAYLEALARGEACGQQFASEPLPLDVPF
jgi:hypothetical protein